ncbi:MAG: sigma-54-dependent Fis family transcriptional regulator [Gammaproteobacteria bacterium]|nr:sigma-54-dependent Fis family transcriptional regulator [Gammaproteobacteria bacterium]
MSLILIVDDEPQVLNALSQTLELEGYEVISATSAEEALSKIEPGFEGVVMTDINMPHVGGIELLSDIQKIDKEIPVIMLTGHANVALAVDAMHFGAYDFLEKPFSSDSMIDTLTRATEKRRLTMEINQLQIELETQTQPGVRIVGKTSAMKQLRALLYQIKDTLADVLVEGETGCGKELISRYLHYHGPLHDKPFVGINCGAIPETMIESELFGHEAGAFTDAKSRRIGKFEYANGGTILLDEFESMPMSIQTKLLRVLEERTIERLGGNKVIPINIRVIAATKVDLLELSKAGKFREDLYYRVKVLNVKIPPLRDRLEDVPLLFEHFSLLAANTYSVDVPLLSAERRHWLSINKWPGGVREVRNLATCFVLLGEEGAFEENNFPNITNKLTLAEQVNRFEESLIRDALIRGGGQLNVTQKSLGIARKTLYEKMRKYNLDKQQFRE